MLPRGGDFNVPTTGVCGGLSYLHANALHATYILTEHCFKMT